MSEAKVSRGSQTWRVPGDGEVLALELAGRGVRLSVGCGGKETRTRYSCSGSAQRQRGAGALPQAPDRTASGPGE